MRGLIVLVAALVTVSCARGLPVDPLVRAQLDAPFSLRVGQTAIIERTPLRLRFERVVEDSRCPVDVVCVWAGDAEVRLVLSHEDSDEAALDLHLSLEPRAGIVHGYRVALEGLQPARHSERGIAQDEYQAELRAALAP